MPEYQYAQVDLLAKSEDKAGGVHAVCPEEDANCVISLKANGYHVPMIDIDFPARLVPSSTEGHFHLYLDGIQLSPVKYEKLLRTLFEVGILEEGNYFRYQRDGVSVLRKEGVKKLDDTLPNASVLL